MINFDFKRVSAMLMAAAEVVATGTCCLLSVLRTALWSAASSCQRPTLTMVRCAATDKQLQHLMSPCESKAQGTHIWGFSYLYITSLPQAKRFGEANLQLCDVEWRVQGKDFKETVIEPAWEDHVKMLWLVTTV
jgi:hypothetical protein